VGFKGFVGAALVIVGNIPCHDVDKFGMSLNFMNGLLQNVRKFCIVLGSETARSSETMRRSSLSSSFSLDFIQ